MLALLKQRQDATRDLGQGVDIDVEVAAEDVGIMAAKVAGGSDSSAIDRQVEDSTEVSRSGFEKAVAIGLAGQICGNPPDV